MRRAARVDANQAGIVELFRAYGGTWLSMASLGKGAPDGVLGYWGMERLVEIKNPKQKPSARKLRPGQEAFRATWMGHRVAVIESEDQALELLREIQREVVRAADRVREV